jgi:two-component system cell cycle response regulator
MMRTFQGVDTFVELLALTPPAGVYHNVLLVDDDPAMCRLLERLLKLAGYHVRTARDGSQALRMLHESCPDFVVTDWEMPGIDGIQLCETIRGLPLPQYIYILLMTACDRPRDMVRGIAAGADEYCAKPVVPAELFSRLQAGARVLETQRELAKQARIDSLTGLMNRRTFHEAILVEWARSDRNGSSLCCAMADLDQFKQLNDRYGHLLGDTFLSSAAHALRCCSRKTDVCCRYGGEEFCVLLAETDVRGGRCWADRFRAMVGQIAFEMGDSVARTTVSIGIAQRTPGVRDPTELIYMADLALLEAKRRGRNRVVAFGEPDHSKPPDGSGRTGSA